MAKPMRGGLGRGLNSLIGGGSSTASGNERTTERETIRYNEQEDAIYDSNGKRTSVEDATNPKNIRAKSAPTPPTRNVSRETSENPKTSKVIEKASEERRNNALDESRTTEGGSTEGDVQESRQGTPKVIPTDDAASTGKKDVRKNDNDAIDDSHKDESSSSDDDSRSSKRTFQEVKDATVRVPVDSVIEVSIDSVEPNPEQPRTNFDEEELRELSNSIKRNGLIQPILVRALDDGTFQIVAGERRWQASKNAGLDKIQVQVKDIDDNKALEYALIENIQRSDLNPIEEAYGYKRLMERNQMTQADIAQAVSKARSTIANTLRLLELPEEAQQMLFEEKITAGHARAILSVTTREDRLKLTYKVIDNKLTVRETENIANLMNAGKSKRPEREPQPAVYKSVARALKNSLDAQVKIRSSRGKNRIEIEFDDEKDLERLFDLINPE